MALVTDPSGRAQTVRSEKAAAELYARVEAGLLSGEGDNGWRDDATDALRILEQEWGAVVKRRPRSQRPGQGSTTRTRQRASKETRTASTGSARDASRRSPGRVPSRSSAKRATRPPAAKAAPSSRRVAGGRVARKALRETGIPRAAGSTSSLLLSTLGLMIGMSVLYLLLRQPKAFDQLTGGATRAVRTFVRPVDPLAPRAKKPDPSSAGYKGGAAVAGLDTSGLISAGDKSKGDKKPVVRPRRPTPLNPTTGATP